MAAEVHSQTPMRVILVCQYYPPERGAVRYGHSLARGLASRGHAVTVVAGLPHYPSGIPYEGFGRWKPVIRHEDSVRVVRTPLVMGSNRQPLRRILGFFTFLMSSLPWILFSRRPDVVIASVPPATVAIAGFIGSVWRRCPLIVVLRDIEPLRALRLRGLSDRMTGRAIIRAFMWLYRRAARIVVVHASETDVLRHYKIPGKQIVVITHGVDPNAYTAQDQRGKSVVLPRRGDRSVALYLGTMGMVHDLTSLVKTVADPRIRSLPVDFVIVGDGEFKAECLAYIEAENVQNVTLLPSVPMDGVPSLLAQADILIGSYRDEAGGVIGAKFCEYCAAGKPILIYGRSLAAVLVAEIGNGLACRAGDVESLEIALQDLLSRSQFWRDRGRLGQEYACRHFAQDQKDEQWEFLLQTVVSP